MTAKKRKHKDITVKLDMSFEEAVKKLANTPKTSGLSWISGSCPVRSREPARKTLG